ncbi:GNAT family N-acetyltransferase [Undibacterium jejuense]|uniref:GNAT family N-acetyltransferase n=1 Tax=Undibacterium jejuense TaxID=1344949 RepID=A0A923HM01_9BURK|nr:GNAT family N-acetyltransferase [Undibacterium jejuense]MBC3862086.1 GNAT family N-acetyltransferase [Undibacterium jejuense]
MNTIEASTCLPQDLLLIRVCEETQLPPVLNLMQQLRPHLTDVSSWIAYWKRASQAGYRLWSLKKADQFVALASYRIAENLVHGHYLYVEDLVTDQAERGVGYGQIMMEMLKQEALEQGCGKIVLDTGLNNALAHRFYYRQGLLASSLRFNQVLST